MEWDGLCELLPQPVHNLQQTLRWLKSESEGKKLVYFTHEGQAGQ